MFILRSNLQSDEERTAFTVADTFTYSRFWRHVSDLVSQRSNDAIARQQYLDADNHVRNWINPALQQLENLNFQQMVAGRRSGGQHHRHAGHSAGDPGDCAGTAADLSLVPAAAAGSPLPDARDRHRRRPELGAAAADADQPAQRAEADQRHDSGFVSQRERQFAHAGRCQPREPRRKQRTARHERASMPGTRSSIKRCSASRCASAGSPTALKNSFVTSPSSDEANANGCQRGEWHHAR